MNFWNVQNVNMALLLFKKELKEMQVKEWEYDIEVTWSGEGLEADSKADLIEVIKEVWMEKHNIELRDEEIKNIKEVSNAKLRQ